MSRYTRSKSQRSSSARRNLRSRRANSAIPGYDNLGWEDFGHPASADQPGLEDYGIDSDFGEGVRKGPYGDSSAPASYGWEPDHPASKSASLRDRKLRKAMERKATKCIKIAESRLGKFASQREIEDLALRFMDLPNKAINSRVASLDHHMADLDADDDIMGMHDLDADDHDVMGMHDLDADDDDVMGMHDHFGEDDDDIMGMHDHFGEDDDDIMGMHDLDADDDDIMGMHDHFGEDDDDVMGMHDLDADDDDIMGMHDHFGEDDDIMGMHDLDADDDDIMGMMDEPVMGMHDLDADDDLMGMMDEPVMGMHDHFGEDDDIMGMMDEPVMGTHDIMGMMDEPVMGMHDLSSSFEEDAAEVLAEEVTTLKAANARLARKVRRLSVRMAAQEEASEEVLEASEEEAEEKEISKKASTSMRIARIERLANALSDYMAEMERQASEEEASEEEASEEEASEEVTSKKKAKKEEASEEEASEEEASEEETSKKAYHSMADVLADLEVDAEDEEVTAEDPMGLDASDLEMIDPKLASIFTASDDDDDEEDEDETDDSEEEETSKKASYRPSKRTRQASVKTLGNISRSASSSDELSKLWESAPDVSKFFG